MTIRKFGKKVISIILAITIIFPIIPVDGFIALAADEPQINQIIIYRDHYSLTGVVEYGINIIGINLRGLEVSYKPVGESLFKSLNNPEPGSSNSLLQYKINAGEVIEQLLIGNQLFTIEETNMPSITSVEPVQVNLSKDDSKLTVTGGNFDEFKSANTTIKIDNKDFTALFGNHVNNKVELNKNQLINNVGTGNKSIVIEKKSTSAGNVDIRIVYNYKNVFRVFNEIPINPQTDVTIFPNMGKIGSQVTITINGINENYSVFFLEKETDLFKYENLGESPEYVQTTPGKSIIRVRVPKGLTAGRIYKLFITNNLDNVKKEGLDLTNFVTQQLYIGDFYVLEDTVAPVIEEVEPNRGTSDGSYVTIRGKRFEELNITGLVVGDNTVSEDMLSIEGGGNEPTKLKINFKTNGMKYNGKDVVSISRDFLVTIGRDALFEEAYLNKQIFRLGEDLQDELYVKTKTIDPKDLTDPTKDVILSITTIIRTRDINSVEETFEFTEVVILERGYTFLPSYQKPTVLNITPNLVEVDGETYKTKNTTIHSIEGENFNVFRYITDNGEIKTSYPEVLIGGTSSENALLRIERNSDGEIVYYVRKDDGTIQQINNVEDAVFEVLDGYGNTVTGVEGNQTGRFITFTIPEGIDIPKGKINSTLPIAVANPKRDSDERSTPGVKENLIKFVIATSKPSIESVTPNIVTVDGGEEVVVVGKSFMNGVEVYIAGKKVEGVIRELDPISTNIILRFKAPKGREGITVLQVMNPDGGSDTYPFIYVETLKMDPKITSIAPPRGTAGDVIIIKGDNFLKSDLTVTDLRGMGIYRLLGTRVYLGNEEVNQYNDSIKNGELEKYTVPEITDEDLITIEKNRLTSIYELNLSPYYKAAKVSNDGKYYTITTDRDGNIVLIGAKINYTFNYAFDENGNPIIKASDGTNIYKVSQEGNKLVLESENGEKLEFNIEYDLSLFSININPYGTKELKVADYYESIFLRDDDTKRIYKITNDQLNRVTITDERENTFNVKIDGDNIIATKGNTTYDVKVEKDHIEIIEKNNPNNILKLYFVTPYYIDPQTKIITGHRVRVLSKNQIEFIVPEKQIPGYYDVKVENPDTKSFTVVKGFEYTKPQMKPVIYYIEPSEGSVDGGYYITIYGENFGENPEVRIDGVLVAAKDTYVNKEDFRSIKVLVPKYTGDIDTDFITDKKYVRVHVTAGGASTSRDDLFAYKLASSKPRITRINPVKGSTAGGNVVEIIGTDFRFYEPYNGNPPKEGDTNYEDIDRNGEWTNYMADDAKEKLELIKVPLNDPTIKIYDYYYDSPVLPSVYFGNNKAKIVEFERISGTETYRILVLAPSSNTAGTVDVYIRNNDSGQSQNVKYTYEASKPTIISINTNSGKRTGGEVKDLIATGYKGNQIKLIDENGNEKVTSMYLVRFGEITNRNITDTEDENYGQILKGTATVEFKDSGLTVSINGSKLNLTLVENKKEYKGEYELISGAKFINLKSLKTDDNTQYPGYELVKVEKADGRLLVDRGYSPEVIERISGTLEVTTPSYYRATTVNVTIENPDGISNKVPFTYLNPGSKPTITNILRDGDEPSIADDGNSRVVQLRSKGGYEIKVIGTDFRPNATIYIGNFLQIKPEFISDTELVFTMPEVKDVTQFNKWHVLKVVNEDGGEARSDRRGIGEPPIYIVITESESNPVISSLEPNKGPVTGGTLVTIRGNDFRNLMEGFEDQKLIVKFGDKDVENITYNNYDSITVTAPSADKPGPVVVKVMNPDGTLSQGMIFTYISKPSIKSISPNKLFTNDTETVVTIKGSMFQKGLRVIVGAKLEDAKATDTIKYISGVKDGKNVEKVVVGGLDANVVEFVSEEEIKVTFPEVVDLENTSIIIINPDGGISDPYDNFRFEIPIPTKPMVLEAVPGYESTVLLIWSKSDEKLLNRAEKYEIYGRKTSDKENTFIGTTTEAEFLVKYLEPDTQYTFMVRALNKYGASLDFAIVTVRTLSKYQDSKLNEKEDKLKEENEQLQGYGKEEIVNDRYVITLGTKFFKSGSGTLDLTLSKYKNQNKITIAIPIDLARKDNKITIKDGTMTGIINVRDLYTLQVSRLDNGDEGAYIRIHIDKSTGTHLPLGKVAASKAYDLYFDYYYGKNYVLKINQLLRNGLLFMEQDTLTYPNTRNTKLYIFNVETGEYEPVNSTTADIKGSMKFILLSDK